MMGAYCTHYRKLYLWFSISPVGDLEMEVCCYLWFLCGRGYSPSYLQVAVSALRALEDLGWIPQMVTKKVWRCNITRNRWLKDIKRRACPNLRKRNGYYACIPLTIPHVVPGPSNPINLHIVWRLLCRPICDTLAICLCVGG